MGATWLLKRLRQDKREADADFRRVIDAKFDRAAQDAEDALLRYEASVVDEGERFASVAADMIEVQAEALTNAVQRVEGQGDRAEAHATRIAAKRLRYLLEGVEDASASVPPLIDELKELQDTLGELHDSQLFGGQLASMIAEVLADEGDKTKSSGNGGPAHERAKKPSPVAGLRVLSRRMRQAESSAFGKYSSTWSAAATAGFTARISSLAAELRATVASPPSKKPTDASKTPVRRRRASAGR